MAIDHGADWPEGAIGSIDFDNETEALAWKMVVDAALARGEWPPKLTPEALKAALDAYLDADAR